MSFRRSKVPKFIPIVSLLILLVLGPIVFSFLQNASGVEAAWVDDNFSYRNAIPITSHTAAENNVYVSATIDTSASGQFQADCGDLRFTTVGGDILPYYIVSGCVSASTVVHVFFKSMPAGAQTLYYYYGNPSAANGFNSADFATVASSYALGTVASQEKGGAPIAYWKFDEGTGTTTKDSSSNSNTGTITNAIWKEESLCANGKCLYYDGSGDYVTVSDPSNGVLDFGTSQNFTVAAWAKIQNPTAYHSFLGKCGQDNTCPGYEFFLNGSTIYFRMTWTGGPQYGTSVTTTYDIRDNNWHYMVAVVDRTAEKVYLYGDGKLLNGSGGSITGVGNIDNSNDLTIGTAGAGAWKGFLDDAKLYNYARTAAQIKSDFKSRGTAKGISSSLGGRSLGEGLSNGLVGYWKMDEVSGAGSTLADSSGNSNTGTAVLWGGGNTSTDSAHVAGKFGNSFSFDGGDDYVDAGNGSSLNFSNAITVSTWINKTATGGTYRGIVDKGRDGYGAWSLNADETANTITFKARIGGANNSITAASTYTTGQWEHYVGTFDGSTLSIYKNGSLSNSTPVSGTLGTNSVNVRVGAANDGYYFNGKTDEVRIYNRALSPREVRDLYNWAPGPVGYWPMEESTGNVNDASGNGNAGTATGTTSIQGKFGKSRNFDGSNDYLTTPTSSIYAISNAITLEGWIYPTTISGARNVISNSNPWDYRLYYAVNTLYMQVSLDNGNTGYHSIANVVNVNTWQHVAGVFDGSTVKLYVNGIQVLSEAAVGSIQTPGSILKIGANGNSGEKFQGGLDEVKIYNYARTQKQIVEDMNAGHPAGGSPVGSQVGYWRFDEGSDNTCPGGTNDVCNSGSAGSTLDGTKTGAVRTNDGKIGKSISFSGASSDYVQVLDNDSLTPNNEVTVSAWIYPTSTSGQDYKRIVNKSNASDAGEYTLWMYNSRTIIWYVNNWPQGYIVSNTTVPLNQWTHIAGTFSSGNLKLYINGKLDKTGSTTDTTITNTSNNLYIGNRGAFDRGFPGIIDEIKIYSAALTEDEIKLDYNRGSAMVLGTLSDTSGLTGGSVASSSASAEYCIPGDTATCTPPVARWDFEEKSGTNAYDSSGNGNTGTLTNGPTWSLGKVGAGINFAGDNDFISTGIATHPTSFTVEAWANTDVTDATIDTIFSKFTSGPYNGFFLRHSSGSMTAQVYNAGTGYVSYATITPGVWNHWTMTFDGSTIRLYKDGVQTDSDSGTMGTTTQTLVIGGNYTGPSEPFDGKIDNVKYFNYARTPAQIAWDYNRGGPVGHWRMDECQGATAKDSSGNGNNGTITIGATGTQTAVGTCTTSGTAWYNGVTGKFNSSLNFDGTDDYVQTTGFTGLASGGQITMSAWVKPTLDASQNIIIDRAGTSQIRLEISTSNTPNADIGNGTSWCNTSITGGSLTSGQWAHLAVTYDNSTAYMYVNGVKVGTPQSFSCVLGNTGDVYIGRFGGATGYEFPGQIDDVRIYNYALTASQIKTLFNGGAAVKFGPVTGSP